MALDFITWGNSEGLGVEPRDKQIIAACDCLLLFL